MRNLCDDRSCGASKAAEKFNMSPEGTAELSPGRQSWVRHKWAEQSRQGRLNTGAEEFSRPSRDWMLWIRFTQDWTNSSRPFGTPGRVFPQAV
jgi:hypothetical protein